MRRRRLLGLVAATVALPSCLSRARAQGTSAAGLDPARAAAFIKETGAELGRLVGGARDAQDKRERLQPFVDRVVDVDAVARFCLGRHWRGATPEQQREYLRLFHGVLLTNIVSRMGDYQKTEVKVNIGQPDTREDGVHVPTVVERTGNPPARVSWVVQADGGAPRIVDVIAEGTSLRLTVRSDYTAFLLKHGNDVGALNAALREQARQNEG